MTNKLKWGSVLLIIAILVASVLLVRTKDAIPEIAIPAIEEGQVTEEIGEEKTTTFSLYFPNSIQDPGFMDCRVVRSTERVIPYTQGVATAAITELLKGPTGDEQSKGFVTQLDPAAKLQSIRIADGIARVDFSKELNSKNVGLCAGQFIKAQIEQTLLQFPTIDRVVVSIDGDEEFVQP